MKTKIHLILNAVENLILFMISKIFLTKTLTVKSFTRKLARNIQDRN